MYRLCTRLWRNRALRLPPNDGTGGCSPLLPQFLLNRRVEHAAGHVVERAGKLRASSPGLHRPRDLDPLPTCRCYERPGVTWLHRRRSRGYVRARASPGVAAKASTLRQLSWLPAPVAVPGQGHRPSALLVLKMNKEIVVGFGLFQHGHSLHRRAACAVPVMLAAPLESE